jgi:hypothetical protein
MKRGADCYLIYSKLLADFCQLVSYLPIVLNVFRVILMETHCRLTTMSAIFATTILKIHMSSQGKADSIEF